MPKASYGKMSILEECQRPSRTGQKFGPSARDELR
jgi:hypothetical protein